MEHITFTDALRILILQHAGAAYRSGRTTYSRPEMVLRLTYLDLLNLTHERASTVSDAELERRVARCFLEADAEYSQQEALDLAEEMAAEFWGTTSTNVT